MAVGDIVKVVNGQYLPADVVLLSSRSGGLVGRALKSVLRTVECHLVPGEDSGHLPSTSGSPPPPTLLLFYSFALSCPHVVLFPELFCFLIRFHLMAILGCSSLVGKHFRAVEWCVE